MDAGDVIIILQQQEHESFKRQGSDLMLKKSIGVTEALCGFSMVIKHLDGRDILIKNPPGSVISPGMCLNMSHY